MIKKEFILSENISKEEFSQFINKVSNDFIPSLFERIKIPLADYYAKLSTLGKIIACKDKCNICGLIAFYSNDTQTNTAYITLLATDSQYRGQGIASKLLEKATEIARQNKMTSIRVHTNNEKACRLYQKHGFSIVETAPFSDNSNRYLLSKTLSKPRNILLTSAGRRTYLVNYFKKALEGKGLVYASNSKLTYTLTQADKYLLTPNIYDDNYIDFLLNYCQKENISAIIPLFDIDLPVLAKNKAKFEENSIKIIVSDEWVAKLCNDKWETYSFLKPLGIKQAFSSLSIEEVKTALANKQIDFPLILKPRWGMGSIGIYQADNLEELPILYAKLQREIFKTYLQFESASDKNACIIIQEKLKGQEFGFEVLNDLKGNYVTTIAKKKLAMRAGETDIAQIVDNTPFVDIAKKLSSSLKHIANLDVDSFLTDSGEVYILEMNCRFGGQYPFSHNAGVDFPQQIINWLESKATDKALITPKIGTISCKELIPVVFNVPKTHNIAVRLPPPPKKQQV